MVEAPAVDTFRLGVPAGDGVVRAVGLHGWRDHLVLIAPESGLRGRRRASAVIVKGNAAAPVLTATGGNIVTPIRIFIDAVPLRLRAFKIKVF